MSTLEATPTVAAHREEPGWRLPWWVEALSLLLAPGVVALLLRSTPLSVGSPDPTSASARPGADLLRRLDPADDGWMQIGQALPAHLAQLAVGDAAGLVVLRYLFALLATVPAYLWLRRRSVPAGAVAVAVVLTSPVVLTAWTSDRPDGAALTYLLAGLPLIAIWTTGPRRLLLRGVGGLFLGLAMYSHPAAVVVVAAVLVAMAMSAYSRHTGVRRARSRRVSVELVAVLGGMVLATVLAVLGALLLDGRADVVAPPIDQLLQRSAATSRAPTVAGGWAHGATYLLVPPVVVLAWSWLCRRRRLLLGEWPPRGDAVVVLGTGLGYLAFLAIQVVGGSAMEDHLTSSLLWAGTCLTTALLLSTLSSSWWPVAAVLGLAVLQVEVGTPRFEVVPIGLVLALAVVVAAAVVGGPGRRSVPMLVVTVGLTVLTMSAPLAPGVVGSSIAAVGGVGAVSTGHP